MSSNARKQLPAEVLAHPAVLALITSGQPTGSITPDEVRQASEDAAVEEEPVPGQDTAVASIAWVCGCGAGLTVSAARQRN